MNRQKIAWLFRMAWMDSRRNQAKLLLFISSIVVGIAALVAVTTFGENLQKDIDREAKTLLSADLLVSGGEAAADSIQAVFDELGAIEQVDAVNVFSFVFFPESRDSRIAQVKAVNGKFPIYGQLETTPDSAASIDLSSDKFALVENTLLEQFDITIGETVRVGSQEFTIVGQIDNVPGRSSVQNAVLPLVLIHEENLAATKMLKFATNNVFYEYFFQLPDAIDVDALAEEKLKNSLKGTRLNYETVQSRKETFGEIFSNLTDFLNLIGFIALILGCIGVASSVHIYIKDKLPTVAILRCLGAKGREAFLIFLIQVSCMGFIGALIGAALGSLLQLTIPVVLEDFLPIENVSSDLSARAILEGIVAGVLIALLFALLPLVRIRRVSPLRSLRLSYERDLQQRDPLRWLVYLLIVAFIFGFTWLKVGTQIEAILFPIFIGFSLLVLWGMAKLLMWLVKVLFPKGWSYVWRQSIANLYRPNNQTLILMIAIGLGTGMLTSMHFTRELVLQQIEQASSSNQPNLIVANILPNQVEAISTITDTMDMPIIQQSPIFGVRLEAINGRTVQEMIADSNRTTPRFMLEQEYQVSYRDSLLRNEKVTTGKWFDELPSDSLIAISMEKDFARQLKVKVGDTLAFGIQKEQLITRLSNIRTVKQEALVQSFPIIFPTGILEDFSHTHILMTKSDSIPQALEFQRAVISKFMNVAVVDFRQVLKIIDTVLGKVAFVVQYMALFSIVTGILVLISSVILSKYQRIRESVLLRTLGASRRQILQINALEYVFLGALAALTGIILSILAGFLMAQFAFKTSFSPNWWPPILWLLGIIGLTVFIGVYNSRSAINKPPLEVLRKEVG